MCTKIVVPGRFRIEFKADDAEAFALYETKAGIGLEGHGRIFQDLVVHWGVAGVVDLNGLIN